MKKLSGAKMAAGEGRNNPAQCVIGASAARLGPEVEGLLHAIDYSSSSGMIVASPQNMNLKRTLSDLTEHPEESHKLDIMRDGRAVRHLFQCLDINSDGEVSVIEFMIGILPAWPSFAIQPRWSCSRTLNLEKMPTMVVALLWMHLYRNAPHSASHIQ